MKYIALLLLSTISAHKLVQQDPQNLHARIPDTPEPLLIPKVMEVDQDTKHAICNGTNRFRCREVDPYLKKDTALEPDLHDSKHDDVQSGHLPW